jgi:cell division septation protein DedD
LQIVEQHGFSSIDEIRPAALRSSIPGDIETPREIKYSYVEPGSDSFDGRVLTEAENKKRLLEEQRKVDLSKLTGRGGQPNTKPYKFKASAPQTEEMFQTRANLLKSEGLPTGLKEGVPFKKDGSYLAEEISNQKELDKFQKMSSSNRSKKFQAYMSKYKISETELDRLIAQTHADALAATAAKKAAEEAANDAAKEATRLQKQALAQKQTLVPEQTSTPVQESKLKPNLSLRAFNQRQARTKTLSEKSRPSGSAQTPFSSN